MKIRLDQYLCQNGLVQSRERAKALIMAGIVFVDEQKVDKPGTMIADTAKVEVRGHDLKYVSRGGLKLEKAMEVFPLTPRGKVCMDIGASTGGFTDCMLQNGAVKVYAVDVGYGQLAWQLRCDERVVNMERTNIRHVTRDDLADDIEFFSVDVSFIFASNTSFRWLRPYRLRMSKESVSSSLSLKRDVKRWERKALCGKRKRTVRCCRMLPNSRDAAVFPPRAWIFRPSKGRRATLSSCCM